MAQNSTYQLAPTQTYQAPTTVGLSNVKQPSYAEWMHAANAGNAFQWQQNQKGESEGGFGAMLPMALLGLAAPYAVKFFNGLNQMQQAQQFGAQLQGFMDTVNTLYNKGKRKIKRFFNRPQAPQAPQPPRRTTPQPPAAPAPGTGAQQ